MVDIDGMAIFSPWTRLPCDIVGHILGHRCSSLRFVHSSTHTLQLEEYSFDILLNSVFRWKHFLRIIDYVLLTIEIQRYASSNQFRPSMHRGCDLFRNKGPKLLWLGSRQLEVSGHIFNGVFAVIFGDSLLCILFGSSS